MDYELHQGVQKAVQDLNKLYKAQPALYEKQFSPEGFEWIEWNDSENSVLTYIRKGHNAKDDLIIMANFTPVPREKYRVGVPGTKQLKLLFNSDDTKYAGSGLAKKSVKPTKKAWNGREHSIEVNLPPLGILIYK